MGGNVSPGGSVTFQSWVTYGGGASEETTDLQGPLTGAFSDARSELFELTTPGSFAPRNRTVIALGAAGQFASTDGHTYVANPAPPSLAAALLALPIITLYGWRCRKRVGPA
jgi:hypothetical protein